jgi:hypothetical protein
LIMPLTNHMGDADQNGVLQAELERNQAVNILERWPFSAIRRNHTLEHATIHVLMERHPGVGVTGRSDWGGFSLYGPVRTEDVVAAVSAAARRLRAGECHLAVHPNCGTNVATGLVLAGLTSFAALSGKRKSRLEKALQLTLGLVAAFALARPVGVRVQERLTTSPNINRLRVVDIRRQRRGTLTVHRVQTAQE